MGMFDYVNAPARQCPNCGEMVSGWQSKDGECTLDTVEPSTVMLYYSSCNCGFWLQFKRNEVGGFDFWAGKDSSELKLVQEDRGVEIVGADDVYRYPSGIVRAIVTFPSHAEALTYEPDVTMTLGEYTEVSFGPRQIKITPCHVSKYSMYPRRDKRDWEVLLIPLGLLSNPVLDEPAA